MWRAILLLCLVALVGALPPSPEQCETQWVGAVQAGNCSTKACTDDCLISLAQVTRMPARLGVQRGAANALRTTTAPRHHS